METIKQIYNDIDELFKTSSYSEVDRYIDKFLENNVDLSLNVALLIATFRKRKNLNNREKLYEITKQLATQKCLDKGVPSELIEDEVNLLILELK